MAAPANAGPRRAGVCIFPRKDESLDPINRIGDLFEKCAGFRLDLRLFLGECGYGLVHGDVAVTWKESHPRRIDTKRLRAENPEYAELYTTTKPSRTLLRKGEYA